MLKRTNPYTPATWVFPSADTNFTLFIFPIIAPPDTTVNPGDTIINGGDIIINGGDTIVPGGDTTGVGLRQADLIHRYTAVQPNPATQRATVTSGVVGLDAQEAEAEGRRIHEAPASGYRADLDVSSWPRGACLLRITTPLGTATKKLLLQ